MLTLSILALALALTSVLHSAVAPFPPQYQQQQPQQQYAPAAPCICPPPLPYALQAKANEQQPPQPPPQQPGAPLPPGAYPPQPGPPGYAQPQQQQQQYGPTQAAGYQPPYGQYAITQPMRPDDSEDVFATQGPAPPATPSTPAYTGPEIIQAQTILRSAKGIRGVIRFTQVGATGPVHVTGTISGLTPGKHGFHIHEKGDLRSMCKAAGGHYNPLNQPHGAPQDTQRHVGDLGNIEADQNGVAVVDITDTILSLAGDKSVIGRSVVVHGGEDDLGKGNNDESKKTGNAGERQACGIIRALDFYQKN